MKAAAAADRDRLLQGRVAIVTGAGRGIGRAVAVGFAAHGASVVTNDADGDAARATAAAIEAAGGNAVADAHAVGEEANANATVTTALDSFGRLDIVTHVGGVFAPRPLVDMDLPSFDLVVRVHLTGAFLLARAAVRHAFTPQRSGKLIFVTSRAGTRGLPPGACNYAAAKAGVVGLTMSLAHELQPLGVNVNAVSPVAWSSNAEALDAVAAAAARIERSKNVLNRVAETADVVPTFVFLASAASDYLTGQVLQATGQPAQLL